MKKKIVIHIGLHKTGSTSFQQLIRTNSQELQKHDIYVPPSGKLLYQDKYFQLGSKSGGLHQIPKDIAQGDMETLDAFIHAFEASGCTTAILSSEGHDKLSYDSIQKIASRTEPYDLKIIAVFRNPVDLARSLYCSRGGIKKVDPSTFIRHANKNKLFNYTSIIRNWSSIGKFYPINFEGNTDITQTILNKISSKEIKLKSHRLKYRESIPAPAQLAIYEIKNGIDIDENTFMKNVYPMFLYYLDQSNHSDEIKSIITQKQTPFLKEDEEWFLSCWQDKNFIESSPLLKESGCYYTIINNLPYIKHSDIQIIKNDFFLWLSKKVNLKGNALFRKL